MASFLDAVGLDDSPWWPATRWVAGCRPPSSTTSPSRSSALLLANAVGGPTWALFPNEVRTMVQRPFWDWGRHFGGGPVPVARDLLQVLPPLLEGFIPNLFRNPLGMFRTGEVIRRADLVAEVRAIAARGIPVSVAWSDRDGLVPRSAFDDLRRAAGIDGVVVEGSHAWLIAEPERLRGAGDQRPGRRPSGDGPRRRRGRSRRPDPAAGRSAAADAGGSVSPCPFPCAMPPR